MLSPARCFLAALGVVGLMVGIACSDETIKAPTSDTQFDDPDDPGSGGTPGPRDAGTLDAQDDGPRPCKAASDCDPGDTCFFPRNSGCTTPVGQCIEFVPGPGCPNQVFCSCTGELVTECSPPDLASVSTQALSACAGQLDAGDGGS